MSTQKVAQVTSGREPQKGQKYRSSNNFAIPYLPAGTTSFTFNVVPADGHNTDGIRFNVCLDSPHAKDSIVWGGENLEAEVHNGYQTGQNIHMFNDVLYIGGPSGATDSFVVEIWANF